MEEKQGFFKRLVEGLGKTRDHIVSGIDGIFHGFSQIDDDFYEELEETLIMGDLGVRTTMEIIDNLKEKVRSEHIKEPVQCRQLLIDSIREQMYVGETAYEFDRSKWCRENDDYRKTGRKTARSGEKSDPSGSRYISCRGKRTANRMGKSVQRRTDRRTRRIRSRLDRL